MKTYMMIIKITDGEFEHYDRTIYGWSGDPKDDIGILKDCTGYDLARCSWSGAYESKEDHKLYELYWIKEVPIEHLAILEQYGF